MSISAIVVCDGSSGSRSCTARCWPGRSDVRIEATDGFVHEAWATAWSNTIASFAKAFKLGVVSRA